MITIEVHNTAVQAALSRLQASISDPTPAMQSIGDEMVSRIALGFNDSRDPWGNGWEPLKLATTLKRRHGNSPGADKPLVNFGHLASSFSARADRESVTVGTNWMAGVIATGAAIHQFGGKAGRGRKVTIPPRPFLPIRKWVGELPADWETAVVNILQRYIQGVVNE
ncbi:MAG: phage virion morphogenesis protein [Elusimicrobiota bacterium]